MTDKLAFLIRHEYGPQVVPNNLSIIFGDESGTEGLSAFRYVLVLLHKSPGDEGQEVAFAKTAEWRDDIMHEIRKEVDSMTQKILGRDMEALHFADTIKSDPDCQPS